ncbi:MAG TPA: DUF4450 domain-containing protein [Candidatus Acidoferrales bacterium]|nr:DUF4450 domain-containing protein [Candidatus Acidoferrales bacterium]
MSHLKLKLFAGIALLATLAAGAQTAATDSRPELIYRPHGNFADQIARPLRYWPVAGDFVITNGAEFFNRPLYCLNSAFRIDGGDKPEFSLYLPGRGGNLRLGIKTAAGVKWLNDADKVVARYRPGEMVYDIKDSLLTDARELHLTALPLSDRKGFIVRAEMNSAWMPIELVWAFGGANGMRGSRGGDIGCEREPVSRFFQLQPEQCAGDNVAITTNTFALRSKTATIQGVASPGAGLVVADARQWNNAAKLLATAGATNSLRMVAGQIPLPHEQPVYLALQVTDEDSKILTADELPKAFAAAEDHRRAIAERVVVETPDPFINAAAGALNIAADAVWDEAQQCYMHGAVAWRTRLLGWRGPYAGDALGWHERTAAHFAGFVKQQNTSPIPETVPSADEQSNLARSEAAIHSNGNFSKNHYDMNLVAVDAFFRHLLWTGDLDYAREMWPAIERHLAWERRLFRREFGPDKLPLYEAYAAIWASDDLNYNGGGTAHASAYNYWHNKMAARVAKLLGKDATPYEHEADLIWRGMHEYLWLVDKGSFAEYKDYLGLQLTHPAAGLWTFYHTLDSEAATPAEAAQMARWIDANIAHIPIIGTGVPEEKLFTLPETSWMPYLWSVNNVVMAEAAHTSLGLWQANQPETAFRLFKGELMDSMFLGLCPGNLGCMTGYDMARGEAQRDFADPCGVNSRALVEGLFGIKPDDLAGELKIVPGFPAKWDHASIRHPDINFTYRREDVSETYVVEPKFSKPMKLVLQIPAYSDWIGGVAVNGKPAEYKLIQGVFGVPRVEIIAEAAQKWEVRIEWRGDHPAKEMMPDSLPARPAVVKSDFDWKQKIPSGAKLETINLAPFFNDKMTQIFRNEYRSPRSPFASLALPKQGLGGWCEPTASFNVDDSGLRSVAAKNDGKIVLPDGVPLQTPGEADVKNIIFTSQWDNYPHQVSVPLTGKSAHAYLLMAGSTGPMQSRIDNGEVVVTYTDGTTSRLALDNPGNWWPIDQDYFIDDYAFRRDGPLPPRVDLKTGQVRLLDAETFKGKGGKISGGASSVLDLPLDPAKELKSLTVRALANEVVIGLMSVTLAR